MLCFALTCPIMARICPRHQCRHRPYWLVCTCHWVIWTCVYCCCQIWNDFINCTEEEQQRILQNSNPRPVVGDKNIKEQLPDGCNNIPRNDSWEMIDDNRSGIPMFNYSFPVMNVINMQPRPQPFKDGETCISKGDDSRDRCHFFMFLVHPAFSADQCYKRIDQNLRRILHKKCVPMVSKWSM